MRAIRDRKLIVSLVVIGVFSVVTYTCARWAYYAGWADSYSANAATEAAFLSKSLELLRVGETEASLNLLESVLDGNIVAATMYEPKLQYWLSDLENETATVHDLLCKVSRYRSEYRSPSKDLDRVMNELIEGCTNE